MSERNVESLRAFIDAFNTRDVEAFIAYCHPDIEFHSVFATVFGDIYHGHDGVRTFFRDLAEAWDEYSVGSEVYFDLGECTLTFLLLHARGRHSGAGATTPVAGVARWAEGDMVSCKTYVDREAALRDLDVSADELEPMEP